MARARLTVVELISMLLLGFSLGIAIFMYWNARRELAALHHDNDELSTKTRDAENKAKTFEFKENMAQSYLQQLQADLKEKEKTFTGKVSELQEQLNKISGELKAEKLKHESQRFNADEMQGIQDRLTEDLESCRKSVTKCEAARNNAAKSSSAKNVAALQKELSAAKATASDSEKRAMECEKKLSAHPP